ncbi:MAG: MBOAT family protein [Oscillospiraceae bacterium]|nr:MBOAT family protein [Oscillospiraceae bacterium]
MGTDSVVFLSCFLPLTVLLYRLIPGKKARNILLLGASLLFYCFGGLAGLAILLVSAGINYLFAKLIARGGKLLLGIAVAGNLALLIAYKYLNFFLQDVFGFQTELSLIAPLGISFFTFKSISYLVDIYRKKTGHGSFWQFLLYISFFPQVTAGPITRFDDFQKALAQPDTSFDTFAQGLRRFVIGLAKKLLLAAVLGTAADRVFALDGGALSSALAWVGAVSYLLQIYFDFSGYSDMAIGLGFAFGLTTPENFRYPYIAPTVGDFWRRWHISLSSWFRDYLYIPLGGNRKGKSRAALNKVIVFTLCGIWHGSAWTFLVWGLWHGLFAAIESLLPVKKWTSRIPGRIVGHIYTLLVVMLGFVMFRAQSVEQGIQIICAMFAGTPAIPSATVLLHRIFTGEYVFALLCGAVLCLPIVPWCKANAKLKRLAEPLSWIFCAFLFVLCLLKLASGGFAPFIYAQF